jgi:hypothetical protein
MDKIVISYFLIFLFIIILTYKYLNEAPIIEKFYEDEPKLSIEELRSLSTVAHSFVNGEPLKIPHNLLAPKFYIGNTLIDCKKIIEFYQGVITTPQYQGDARWRAEVLRQGALLDPKKTGVFEDNSLDKLQINEPMSSVPEAIKFSGDGSLNIGSEPLQLDLKVEDYSESQRKADDFVHHFTIQDQAKQSFMTAQQSPWSRAGLNF